MLSAAAGAEFSRLSEETLERIESRAKEINLATMCEALGEMGSEAKISTGEHGRMWMLSWQAALMEEQVADIKTIKDKLGV